MSFTSIWNDLVSNGHEKTTTIIWIFLCELFNRLNLSLWIVGGVKQDATPTKSLAILRWITIGIGSIRGTQQDAEPYQTVDDVMSHRMVQWQSLEGLGRIPNPTILLGAMFSSTRIFGSLKQQNEWIYERKWFSFPLIRTLMNVFHVAKSQCCEAVLRPMNWTWLM